MNKLDLDSIQYLVTKEGETYADYQKQETREIYKKIGVIPYSNQKKTSSGRRF